MAQRLLLPFVRSMMLCGYKNPQYEKHWGYAHYGIDISTRQGGAGDDDGVYASGKGRVLAAGRDNSLGYGAAVLYRGCIGRDGEVCDLVARYMHMREICVCAGDEISHDALIGREGKAGTADYHLHLELDTDTEYPLYTPQVSRGHTFWEKGRDTTVNPSLWLYQSDDRALVTPTYNPAWLNAEDFDIPLLPADESPLTRLLALAKEMENEILKMKEGA